MFYLDLDDDFQKKEGSIERETGIKLLQSDLQ